MPDDSHRSMVSAEVVLARATSRLCSLLVAMRECYRDYLKLLTLQEDALKNKNYPLFCQRLPMQSEFAERLGILNRTITAFEAIHIEHRVVEVSHETDVEQLNREVEHLRRVVLKEGAAVMTLLEHACASFRNRRFVHVVGGDRGASSQFIDTSA